MTDLEALIGLHLAGDIGSVRLGRLLEAFGSAHKILEASPAKLAHVPHIGETIAAKIAKIETEDIEEEFCLIKRHNLTLLTRESEGYPVNLKHTFDPPIVLYSKGAFQPEDALSIAIVGSRRASLYGLSNAERFARELAGCGCTVVSGMARGIDTSAHQGALKIKGARTIAVMGSGFGCLYPPENKELAEEIAQNGCVISEFPVNWGPLRQNFPRRNRVISGLSLGVLVVEAARNSGALITAAFALEQGREVFALPGKIDSAYSCGTNALLKQGAVLVSTLDDILQELPFLPGAKAETGFSREQAGIDAGQGLSCTERVLYTIISSQASSFDDIVEKTGLMASEVCQHLLSLRLKKKIVQTREGAYVRSPDV